MNIYDPIGEALGLAPLEIETIEEMLKNHPPTDTSIKEKEQALAQWADPVIRTYMIERIRAKYKEPGHREKMYERVHANSEIRQIRSETCTKMISNKDTKQKIRDTQSTPEWKAYFKEVMNSPVTKAKKSASAKKMWESQEHRELHSKKISEALNNAPVFYCECCDKYIKNHGNWAKHLRSKSHEKNINTFSCNSIGEL